MKRVLSRQPSAAVIVAVSALVRAVSGGAGASGSQRIPGWDCR